MPLFVHVVESKNIVCDYERRVITMAFFLNGPFANWMLINLALLSMIGLGLLEYAMYGRQHKEQEEAQANTWIPHAQDKINKKRILIMLKNVRKLAKEYRLNSQFAAKLNMLEKEVNQAGAIQENIQTFWSQKVNEIEMLTHCIEAEYQKEKIRANKSASLFFSFVGTYLFVLLTASNNLAPFNLAKLVFWLFFVFVLFALLYFFSHLFYARVYNRTLLKLSSIIVYISRISRFIVIYAVTKIFMFSSIGLSVLYYYFVYTYVYKLLFPATTILLSSFTSMFIIVGEFVAILMAYIEMYKFLKEAFTKKRVHRKKT